MAKVLIVDDNFSDRKIAEAILKSLGAEPKSCSSGNVALEILEKEAYDLFLFDLTMPEISGIELIEKVKKLENHKTTPIVIMSGLDEEEDVRKGIRSGARDYLTKPLDPDIAKTKLAGHVHAEKELWRELELEPESSATKAELLLRGDCQVISINELGGHVFSRVKLQTGYALEIELHILKELSLDPVSIRIESQEPLQSGFRMKFSFIGLTEEKRMAIRSFCQDHFREKKRKEQED